MPIYSTLKSFATLSIEKLDQNVKELLAFCFVFGLILTIIVPPFQKPDESAHFFKAISVSKGNLACPLDASKVFINPIPKYLADFPTHMYERHIAFEPDHAFPKNAYLNTLLRNNFDTSPVNEASSCVLPSVLYFHLGAALSIPVALNANPLVIFYIGRLTNFFVAFTIFVLAIKLTPSKLRLIPLLTVLLPMTLHQIGSYSKDSLHIACATMVTAILLRSFAQKKVHTPLVVLTFIASLTFTILARPYFLPLSLIIFIFPYKRKTFASIVTSMFVRASYVVVLCTIIIWSISQQVYSADSHSLQQSPLNSYVYPEAQWLLLSKAPLMFPVVMYDTFQTQSTFLITSLIGHFGWLDYSITWYMYIFYLAMIFTILIIESKNIPYIHWYKIAIIAASVGGSIVGLSLAFYIYGSSVGARHLNGLQGRYFIVLLPLLFIITCELWKRFGKNLLRFMFLSSLLTMVSLVVFRYYDSSKYVFSTPSATPNEKYFMSLEKETTFVVSIDTKHSMAGIRIYPIKKSAISTQPIYLRIFDESCTDQLRWKVIDVSKIRFSTWNDVLVKPIKNYHSDTLCIKLSPFYFNEISKQDAFVILAQPSSNTPNIEILYNY